MKIGFIGLGIMGRPMALNLLKAGHQLVVYDVLAERMDPLTAAGALAAASSAQVAQACGVMITMLPNSPDVRAAVSEPDGILESAGHGAVLIDMSSIAPEAARDIAAQCAQKGVHMLDAPVSGGEPKAIEGTLSIMAGGDEAVFNGVKDEVLLKMGASAVYCGAAGAGNMTKLANQIIVACNIASLAEALVLAKKMGVSPEVVVNAIRGGLAGSTVMNSKAPMMIAGTYTPGFRVDLHVKDLANVLETGRNADIPLPLTASVMEMFRALQADGNGGDDHSALIKYYEKQSGITISENGSILGAGI